MRSAVAEQGQVRPDDAGATLHAHLLIGQWLNTNPSPSFIRRITLKPGPNGLLIHVVGAGVDLPENWGEWHAQLFAETPSSSEAMAIYAVVQLEGGEVRIQGYVVKGVLVIVSFTRVKEGGDRSSAFCKEFFYRLPESGC